MMQQGQWWGLKNDLLHGARFVHGTTTFLCFLLSVPVFVMRRCCSHRYFPDFLDIIANIL